MKIKHKLSIIWVAALLPQLIYSQPDAPFWINEAWRDMNYPSSHWYMGFSEDRLGRNENTAESLKRLERSAQNKMAESITVQISGKTALEVVGRQRQQGQQISETTDQRYRQSIQASASAEISNAEVRSYHDAQTGRIYAIAAVKKTDLANHYALRAEFHIQLAENAISEAKQLIQLGRKSDALRKLADGRHNLDECSRHLNLLNVVDLGKGATRRLLERETELRRQISAAKAEAQERSASILFFVDGTETIEGADVDVVVSKLKSVLTQNGYRTANNRNDASYHLRINVRSCNITVSGDRTFCYACINTEVTNVKTGKSEGHVNFTGSKTGWRDRETACRKALERAADELWGKIKTDIRIFK